MFWNVDQRMDSNRVLSEIDKISRIRRGKPLTCAETVAVVAAWNDQYYEDAIRQSEYSFSTSYVSSKAGPGVWRLLSSEFGVDINKTNSHKLLREIFSKTEVSPARFETPQMIGVPPQIEKFWGYELQKIECIEAIKECKSLSISGSQGVGKTAFTANLISQLRTKDVAGVEVFIWKSLHYGPVLGELLSDLIQRLLPGQKIESIDTHVAKLIRFFNEHRCVFILDDAQVLLEGERNYSWQQYGQRFKDYGSFFRRVIEEQNNTSLILNSRTRFIDLHELSTQGYPIKTIELDGLEHSAARELLAAKGLRNKELWSELIEKYHGNPLALRELANDISSFYEGNVSDFLKNHSTMLIDAFLPALNDTFDPSGKLSLLDKKIFTYLAAQLESKPSVYISDVIENFEDEKSTDVINSIEKLTDQSLLEKHEVDGKYSLSLMPVIRKYIEVDPSGYFSGEMVGVDG